jgi:signal transduction histidine kinase
MLTKKRSGMGHDFQADIDAVGTIAAVPTILSVVSRVTGMGFSAVARVTGDRWVCLAAHDQVGLGLSPGGELQIKTTICNEIRQSREAVAIDHVAEDLQYHSHHTPALYGFQSYISMPIFLKDGSFYGTLCALDPKPAQVQNPAVVGMFRLFADLIGFHLDSARQLLRVEASLADERAVGEWREQFIAVLGHDLRNPLAAMTAGTRLLQKEQLSSRGKVVVGMMEKSAFRMSALINDVIDLARSQLGKGIQLAPSSASLMPVLQQVIDELRTMHPDRTIETELHLTRPTFADPERMARLLSNLLGNAIKYSTPGTAIQVRAQTYGSFSLSVTNHCPVIPAATLAKLFSPFVRGEGHPDAQGLGLGLYIVSEIAKAHGGTITVSSTDEATCFTFAMPLPQELHNSQPFLDQAPQARH